MRAGMRRIAIVSVLIVATAVIYAQPADVNLLLSLLQSSDPAVRANAFYQLRPLGFGSSDSIKVGIISLLITESAYTKSRTVRSDTESYGSYFGDLVEAVTSLHDTRSINALVGVVDTGDMATRTLAGFGTQALDAVIAKLSSTDVGVRNGATIALQEMLELGTVNDAASLTEVRTALNSMATDANYYVGLSAIEGLLKLAGSPVSGVAKRVMVDIKPGGYPNAINPGSSGVIPVAVLSSASFDATSIDSATVRFGAGQAEPLASSVEDANGDGVKDLVFHFATQQSGVQCGDTAAFLVGQTTSLQPIVGSDSIQTVGCK
jgi:hypothetical protein